MFFIKKNSTSENWHGLFLLFFFVRSKIFHKLLFCLFILCYSYSIHKTSYYTLPQVYTLLYLIRKQSSTVSHHAVVEFHASKAILTSNSPGGFMSYIHNSLHKNQKKKTSTHNTKLLPNWISTESYSLTMRQRNLTSPNIVAQTNLPSRNLLLLVKMREKFYWVLVMWWALIFFPSFSKYPSACENHLALNLTIYYPI